MNKKQILSVIIAAAVACGLFFILSESIKGSKKFEVRHSEAVPQQSLPGGGYVAGSPEIYHIGISPSLTWELSKNNTAFWRGTAFFLLIAAVVFVALTDIGVIGFKAGDSSPSHIAFVILSAAIACYIAAYSSAYANNFVEVSPERYYQIKDNADSLKALFLQHDYIR